MIVKTKAWKHFDDATKWSAFVRNRLIMFLIRNSSKDGSFLFATNMHVVIVHLVRQKQIMRVESRQTKRLTALRVDSPGLHKGD